MTARTPRAVRQAAISLLAIAALTGCLPSGSPTTDVPLPQEQISATAPTEIAPTPDGDHPAEQDQVTTPDPSAGTALAALADLPVKGRAPRTGYDRSLFGAAWADVDRNGCDTRNDELAVALVNVTYKPGTHDCVVLTGVLHDPYSGETIAFQRGQDTSTLVQIDHVVALSDAWQKGAQQWDTTRRTAFANDPLNLQATAGHVNQQKSDGDAATWLPPARGYRCEYVATQVAVKLKWGLWVTEAERDAIVRVLADCPDQPLPTGGLPVDAASGAGESQPEPAVPTAETGAPFENCAAARAAGQAPVRVGDPGYGPHLDRDDDGVGCEG